MQFDSFSEFLAMGGYGFYVWLSFGSCLLILFGIFISSLIEKRAVLKQVAQQSQREQRIAKAKQSKQESSL